MRKFELIKDAPEAAKLPVRATKNSAGYDLIASEDTIIKSQLSNYFVVEDVQSLEDEAAKLKERKLQATLVPTGVTYQGEPTDVLDIRPRSSLAVKNLLIIPNSPGTVDSDYYPNEIKVPMINLSHVDVIIKAGDRIAQAVISQYNTVDNEETVETERTSGFGSTGK